MAKLAAPPPTAPPPRASQVERVDEVLQQGQAVRVKVASVEEGGQGRKRIELAMKEVDQSTGTDVESLGERGGRGGDGGQRDDRGEPRMGDMTTLCSCVRALPWPQPQIRRIDGVRYARSAVGVGTWHMSAYTRRRVAPRTLRWLRRPVAHRRRAVGLLLRVEARVLWGERRQESSPECVKEGDSRGSRIRGLWGERGTTLPGE